MKFRKITALILSMLMLISVCTVAPFNATETADPVVISAPQFAKENQLYILGSGGSNEAWQCWESYDSGLYSEAGVKYFFLPENTNSVNITIYNSYGTAVVMNGITIEANSAGIVPYVNGEKATAVCGNDSYEYIVLTSDADASIYVNDTTNDYTTDDGRHFTDFYEFLIDNKENSVKGSDIAIVTANSLTETTLKKFKGRGNTNWKYSDKKQFNLTFEDTMDIAGISDKKFSLINNERDGAVVRSKVVFDVANEVGLPYSTDTRYIDLYINGSYRGCFQISKKVEMGKKDLIALEDTSEDEGVVDNFNFAVEVDIWNAGSDTQFVSKYGQTVALNTPELEDFDPLDEVQLSQYNFIKNKYNEFETALYTGDMAALEKICDIPSLAKAYLIQEWTKNCDGGLTSTYYTYKADEGKFYAVPVWDFDSGLGNVDCVRAGADISTVYPNGWLTKTITNNNDRNGVTNTLGQAFKLSGTTSDGKTYLDFVKETWKNDFIPAIKVVVGQAQSTSDRLKSIDEYISEYDNAFYNNYVQWGFAWGPEKGLGASYPNTYQGQVDYMRDWTITRTNWITQELLGDEGEKLEEPVLPTEPPTELDPRASFYLAGTIDSQTDWFRRDYPLTLNESRTKATIDLTLVEGMTYRFKIIKDINGENVEYYVCDYDAGVTGQYFFADTSTASLNVKSKHTETVELTLVFDVASGLFTAYHKGEVPTEPIATEPGESTAPSETNSSEPADNSTVPTEPTVEYALVGYINGEFISKGSESPYLLNQLWNGIELEQGSYVYIQTTDDSKTYKCDIFYQGNYAEFYEVTTGAEEEWYLPSDKILTLVLEQKEDGSLFVQWYELVSGEDMTSFPTSNNTKPTSDTTPTESIIVTEPTEKTPVLNKTELSLKAGKTATLSVANADGKVTYKSAKPKVAKVDSNGVVTALKKGSTVITANVNGELLTCNVKITTDPKIKNGKKAVKNNSVLKVRKGKKLTLKITGKAKNIANNITIQNGGNVKITGNKIVIKGTKKGIIKLSVKINSAKKYNFKVKVR